MGGDKACNFNPSVPAFQTLINSAPGTYYPGYPNGYVFPGGLAAMPGFLDARGRYVVDQNATFDHDTSYGYLTNTTAWEMSSSLTLKNIFGYSESDAEDAFDNDASPYPIIDPGYGMAGGTETYRVEARQISDELQLQGRALDDSLNYIVGAFYVSTRSEFDSAVRQVFIVPPTTVLPIAYRFHGITEDESYAIFTQGTYAVTDKLNATAGIRWTWDRLSTRHLPDSIFYSTGLTQEAWQSKPSWTVSLDYQVHPDLMIYATTRGSWRVGGYNLFAPPVGDKQTADVGGNYFLPETVRDVEIGAKFNGEIASVPFRASLAAYYQWMSNVQRVGLGVIAGASASATVTVPSARVSGLESDIQLRPTDWLRIGASYVYTDARFKDNVGYLYGIPSEFGPYGDTPRNSGTLFAEVSAPLPNDLGALSYRVDAFSQSSFYFSNRANTFDPGTKIDGYTLVNMRLDWEEPLRATGLTASVFVKNVGNELYYTGGAPGAQVAGLVSAVYGLPRTYGVDLRYRW
jgi:iron complex outermembrane receptor protein